MEAPIPHGGTTALTPLGAQLTRMAHPHLLQAFMFLAMEPPSEMSGPALTAAKVELLKAVKTLELKDGTTFLGQFTACDGQKGYLDDDTVPRHSKCATFASCVLTVENDRWRGVPFLLSAGKGLDERLCEFRIRFRPQPYNQRLMGADATNELVMRVQVSYSQRGLHASPHRT